MCASNWKCVVQFNSNEYRRNSIFMKHEVKFFLTGTKKNIRCNESPFVGHIMQTIYVFVYDKLNQNKVMSGSTQYSKRKICVLVPK